MTDLALRDGTAVRVRPVRPDDETSILALLRSLSEDARTFRFFSAATDLEAAARWAATVPGGYGVAVSTDGDACVAHAGFAAPRDGRAEVAFAIADRYQGRGLGTLLLGHLAEVASARHIGTFAAAVLPSNERMMEVLRGAGFPLTVRRNGGSMTVEFPTALTPEALQGFDERDQVAGSASLGRILRPRSVAVLGASRRRGTIGGEIFHNLLATGFTGPVYPVNPSAAVVQSVSAYASIRDVPGPVDLAVVVVPAAQVASVARDCVAKGVHALVVISAGFAETGPEGAQRQQELLGICREAGMRLVGPNCMGVINTAPDMRLNATFAPTFPPRGRVGFLSQSGALGLAVIDHVTARGLGLSSFVSVGNKADISGNDLLQYWETDPETDVILLYLESFGNPRRFARIARRVARSKPIVAVKSGRSVAGARATSSHTGALVAASDVTVDALFAQTGVIRTETLAELFDVAALFATQPAPAGRRVGILTNSGGPAILCADACEASGLQVVTLSEETRERLWDFLPAEAATIGPVDMIASARGEHYARALEVLASSGEVDAIIVIFTPPLVTRAEEVAAAIRDAVRALPRRLPVLSVFLSAQGVPRELTAEDVRIPSYPYPEDAARALARAADYAAWRARPEVTAPVFADVRRDEAGEILEKALTRGGGWLEPREVAALLACYGLKLVPQRLARTAEEAAGAAAELGGRVALKVVAAGVIHKSDVGGVRLDLEPSRVAEVAGEMRERVARAGHSVEGFLVQDMAPRGVEMLVGVVHDPLFGPVVACGAGGTAVELLKDVSVRITPLGDRDAGEMIRSLRTYPLLEGYRGAPKADVAALEEVVLRIAALVEAHPEVAELDANPVVVLALGARIVDARVRVERTASRGPLIGLSR